MVQLGTHQGHSPVRECRCPTVGGGALMRGALAASVASSSIIGQVVQLSECERGRCICRDIGKVV
eukprot:2653580-Pleurochrysis_carterae.AAC.1